MGFRPTKTWAGSAWAITRVQMGCTSSSTTRTPKPEEEEGDDDPALEAKDFRDMSASAFAALDTADLATFLEDNGFPADADAETLFDRVANGELKPETLADFLGDANAEMFDPPIIGAEVYRWGGNADARWVRTHEESLDEVCYSYCYYFGLIAVDPGNADRVVIGGVPLLESTDGGATWSSIAQDNVHVDHHHIWIDPNDPAHIINGNDGGINVTYDGGAHWTSCNSPAVGQFLRHCRRRCRPFPHLRRPAGQRHLARPQRLRRKPALAPDRRLPL